MTTGGRCSGSWRRRGCNDHLDGGQDHEMGHAGSAEDGSDRLPLTDPPVHRSRRGDPLCPSRGGAPGRRARGCAWPRHPPTLCSTADPQQGSSERRRRSRHCTKSAVGRSAAGRAAASATLTRSIAASSQLARKCGGRRRHQDGIAEPRDTPAAIWSRRLTAPHGVDGSHPSADIFVPPHRWFRSCRPEAVLEPAPGLCCVALRGLA
jgi:hypothetical protein